MHACTVRSSCVGMRTLIKRVERGTHVKKLELLCLGVVDVCALFGMTDSSYMCNKCLEHCSII